MSSTLRRVRCWLSSSFRPFPSRSLTVSPPSLPSSLLVSKALLRVCHGPLSASALADESARGLWRAGRTSAAKLCISLTWLVEQKFKACSGLTLDTKRKELGYAVACWTKAFLAVLVPEMPQELVADDPSIEILYKADLVPVSQTDRLDQVHSAWWHFYVLFFVPPLGSQATHGLGARFTPDVKRLLLFMLWPMLYIETTLEAGRDFSKLVGYIINAIYNPGKRVRRHTGMFVCVGEKEKSCAGCT